MSRHTNIQTRFIRSGSLAIALVLGGIAVAGCGREAANVAISPVAQPAAPAAPRTAPPAAQPAPQRAAEPAPQPPVVQPQPSPPSQPSSPAPTEVLQVGTQGEAVRKVQERLAALRYDPGAVDGNFGEATRFALYAFQKVNGLRVDGQVGSEVVAALAKPRVPVALVPSGGANRVEVDRTHQLMYVYLEGKLALITHISTGSGKSYCVEGECSKSVTPTGDFTTTWRVDGWRTAPLGRIYKPVYFNGGIAVHGYPSVPLYPASHGCVRIPMHTADVFPKLVGTGWPVYVRAAK